MSDGIDKKKIEELIAKSKEKLKGVDRIKVEKFIVESKEKLKEKVCLPLGELRKLAGDVSVDISEFRKRVRKTEFRELTDQELSEAIMQGMEKRIGKYT